MDELSKKLLGNVILVNDAVATLQCTDDFSDSLLQYFLKKLYIINDDVVAILAGNREEIDSVTNNFPVLGNQFPNKFILNNFLPDSFSKLRIRFARRKIISLMKAPGNNYLSL